MTERVRTLVVVLDQDMRTDDVQAVVDAVSMVRGVASVKLGSTLDFEARSARSALVGEMKADVMEYIRTWETKTAR